jgi:hypothetical protein
MPAEKTISLQSIVELVVVGGRISVFVPPKRVLLPEQPEKGLDVIVDIRLYDRRADAALEFSEPAGLLSDPV